MRPRRPESTQVDRRDRILTQVAAGCAVAVPIILLVWGIVNLADQPLEECSPESSSVCTGPPSEHDTNGGVYDSLPPCVTEDSDGCYWDASEQGNGVGHDVVNAPVIMPIVAPPVTPEPITESTQVDQPPADDFAPAGGPREDYDLGVLDCGINAAPAIDQDEYGNWWAYCEPAMVNDDGTLWTGGN